MGDRASSSSACGTMETLIQPQLNIEGGNCSDACKEILLQALDTSCDISEVKEELGLTGVDPFDSLPDHLIVEVLIRLPVSCWVSAACVKKRWAGLFRSEMLWRTALVKRWPNAEMIRRWPGPIGRGSHKRRYIALHTSKSLFRFADQDGDIHELVGHVYLFLKEQLEVSTPVSYGLLHGTIIGCVRNFMYGTPFVDGPHARMQSFATWITAFMGMRTITIYKQESLELFAIFNQFLACGKKGNMAHELASRIWLAVIDNLDDSEHTFLLLMQIVEEWEVFLPYPYSKSHAVQWRLFERLFTDFRDCLSRFDYYSVLTRAKHKFEYIPSTWLGY